MNTRKECFQLYDKNVFVLFNISSEHDNALMGAIANLTFPTLKLKDSLKKKTSYYYLFYTFH